ncbi:MAG: S-methyl-5'-thioadenosine phosphorylase [Chloroflexota bacterium]
MTESISLAVIGGSGLYELNGLQNARSVDVDTPFGPTSAPILVGALDGRTVAFLPRHGTGHRLMPTEVPYRANVFALKSLGVERIVSVSACGSLREEFVPGDIVIPDQLFDYTKDRARTFFGDGVVAHLSAPEPFCPELSGQLREAVLAAGGTAHRGGTFLTIEGPRFSTKAESHVFRSWGMSLIGMTTAPEAFLAREAEICYAVMAHVTDYDVWHESAAPVTVEAVVRTLEQNTALAQRAIRLLLQALHPDRSCDCPNALAGAIITRPGAAVKETLLQLGPLVSKYIAL